MGSPDPYYNEQAQVYLLVVWGSRQVNLPHGIGWPVASLPLPVDDKLVNLLHNEDDKLVNLLYNEEDKLAKPCCLRAIILSTCYIMWITSWSPCHRLLMISWSTHHYILHDKLVKYTTPADDKLVNISSSTLNRHKVKINRSHLISTVTHTFRYL